MRVDERARQLLIQRDVGRRDVEIAQLDFGFGPREAQGPIAGAAVAIAIGELQRRFARCRHRSGKRHGC